MQAAESYVNERLDHLGIVAGVCEEIGLTSWLNEQDPTNRQQVSVGTATTAMILNGLGFSNRQLYLVPQYFATKPVEHLLGQGITADMLNDDCLGRTLDWLYAHDPTKLFAGIARRARQVFGVQARQIHVDTTSFSVSGDYTQEEQPTPAAAEAEGSSDPALIAITYGYSRDHREDLKQWMLALATTHEGDIPLFFQPLSGNTSDKESLLTSIQSIQQQLRESGEEAGVYVADNGVYSEANMRTLNQAQVRWISRVSETGAEAKAALARIYENWQSNAEGSLSWVSQIKTLPQGQERWLIMSSPASKQRAQASLQRQVQRGREQWEKKAWHLGTRRFACQADAASAWEREKKGCPDWLDLQAELVVHTRYASPGRPRKGEEPALKDVWQIVVTATVNDERVSQEAFRKACWIIATNILEPEELSDEALSTTYKEQGGVERGFRFLKDPLFLASSVFVKKPERIMALSLIMVLCLLISRLAEFRLRTRLAETEQTIPDQVNKPTARPTMRWVFQCFEGIELLHLSSGFSSRSLILRLQPVHQLILSLLGPRYAKFYLSSS